MDDISDRDALFLAIGLLTASVLPLHSLIEDNDGRPTEGEFGKAFDEIVKTCKKVEKVIQDGLVKTRKLVEGK